MSVGKTALSAVATAVYGALAGDATLMALLPGGVWDHAPEEPTFPLLQAIAWDEEPRDTGGWQCRTVKGELHIWSTYAGLSQAFAILDRAIALLRRQSLTLTGWTCEAVFYDGGAAATSEIVEGVEIQHVVAGIRILVEESH